MEGGGHGGGGEDDLTIWFSSQIVVSNLTEQPHPHERKIVGQFQAVGDGDILDLW